MRKNFLKIEDEVTATSLNNWMQCLFFLLFCWCNLYLFIACLNPIINFNVLFQWSKDNLFSLFDLKTLRILRRVEFLFFWIFWLFLRCYLMELGNGNNIFGFFVTKGRSSSMWPTPFGDLLSLFWKSGILEICLLVKWQMAIMVS